MSSLRFLPEQIEQWPLARLKPYERTPALGRPGPVLPTSSKV
jgi:hypothetical protein